MAAEDLITVTEAGRILGAGRSTILYLIGRGDLTGHRLPPNSKQKGHKYYLRRGDVERLAAGDSWRRYKKRGEKGEEQ